MLKLEGGSDHTQVGLARPQIDQIARLIKLELIKSQIVIIK